MAINLRSVYAVAKKEFMDNLRNKWIIAMTVLFASLTIIASILAGSGSIGGMSESVTSLLSIASVLIPIIAIMLGYSTIAGEAESGSLCVVLSYPIKRIEVLFGKYMGLGLVIVFSTVVGFGIGGVIIAASAGGSQWGGYLIFIGLTALLGFLYLSLAICLSALFKRRVTAMAGGIVAFFWSMIYGMLIMGIYLSQGGKMGDFFSGSLEFPTWIWQSIFFSPGDMYQMASMMAFDVNQAFGVEIAPPGFMTMGTLVLGQLVWTLIPMILAYIFFERRDI